MGRGAKVQKGRNSQIGEINFSLVAKRNFKNSLKINPMKKFILSICLLMLVVAVQAQSKTVASLVQKYEGEKESFHLELGGNFMNFADGFNLKLDEKELETVIKSIQKINFITLSEKHWQSGIEFNTLKNGLERERYELLLEAVEGKDGVMIYSKGGQSISDLVVVVSGSEGDLTVAEFKGSFEEKLVFRAIQASVK
jgi:hypothetical protein